MSNFDINNTVTLTSIIKAVTMSLHEDFTKMEATLTHFAGRAWNEINNQYIGAKIERGIFPIHKNFNTVTIPAGTKKVLFVGLINDCGEKIPLINNSLLTGCITEHIEHDKCNSCNQDKDICEQLVELPIEENIVLIDGQEYVNSIIRIFDSGNYFLLKKTWVKDFTTNKINLVETQEFLSSFDMLPCGCIAPTNENIEKVKTHCYDCYCKCYSPCFSSEYSEGEYRVDLDNQQILLNRNFPYEKIYVEYKTSLPRVNGELVVPEIAFEAMVSGTIYKYTQNKRNVSLGERQLNERNYIKDKKNMHKIMCRINLEDVFNSIRKIPKFDIEMNKNLCGYRNYGDFTAHASTTATANAIVSSHSQQIRTANLVYIGLAGETFFTDARLTDRELDGFVFKDGVAFTKSPTATLDPNKKHFLFNNRFEITPNVFVGRIELSVGIENGEEVALKYYIK